MRKSIEFPQKADETTNGREKYNRCTVSVKPSGFLILNFYLKGKIPDACYICKTAREAADKLNIHMLRQTTRR